MMHATMLVFVIECYLTKLLPVLDTTKLETYFKHISYFYERNLDHLSPQYLIKYLAKPSMQISIYKLVKTLIRFENINPDL